MDNKNYQDHFFRKAKDKGYRSRSAFKLIELNTKFKFLKNNIKLLDVGSFPGGWSQVVKEKIKNGKILGIDKKKTEEIKGIKFITGDFSDEKSKVAINNYFNSSIDVILSDMAANTTGNKSLDCIRTNQLCLFNEFNSVKLVIHTNQALSQRVKAKAQLGDEELTPKESLIEEELHLAKAKYKGNMAYNSQTISQRAERKVHLIGMNMKLLTVEC